MSIQQDRLSALIKFTQQTLLMGKTTVTSISQHTDFLRTEEQLQNLPGVKLNQNTESVDETWLSIERLHASPATLPDSTLLKLWIEFPQKFSDAPKLKERVLTSHLLEAGVEFPNVTLTQTKTKNDSDLFILMEEAIELQSENESESEFKYSVLKDFFDKATVEKELNTYIETTWKPWLEQEKQIQKSIKLYSDLFLLTKELQGNLADAKLELVWGVGIVLWNQADAQAIKYPLLTQSVEISLNKDTMALSVRPSLAPVKLETEIFSSTENPNLLTLIETSKIFFESEDLVFNPFKTSTYTPILKSAAMLLDSSGKCWADEPNNDAIEDRRLPKTTDNLVITDTWVLMARPRGDNFLLQDLEKFADRLTDNTSEFIPGALSAILTEPDTENKDVILPAYRGISAVMGSEDNYSKPNDLYFPKAYNDEQVRIIQMLQAHDGVVVQGPPGTGKTHTIANVICHYLALGKRVLVTSMKDPALSVLKEKLPESIRPLAVSLLSSDPESIKQFESSIRKISSEISSIDRKQYQNTIKQLDEEIDATHAYLVGTDSAISHWGRLNLEDIIIDDEHITPLQAAGEVASKQADISWFPDKLDIEGTFKPQFTNSDIVNLQMARLNLKEDLAYLNKTIPKHDSFPPITEVIELHQNLIHIEKLKHAETAGTLPRLIDSSAATIQAIENLLPKTTQLKSQLNEINEAEQTWTQLFRQHLSSNSKTEIIDYFVALKKEIDALIAQRTIFITKPVSMSQEVNNNTELTNAIRNLTEGRKPFGLAGLFGKSAEKKLLEDIKVIGAQATTSEDWQHVLAFIEFKQTAKTLIIRWNALSAEISLPSFEPNADSLLTLESAIKLTETIQSSYQLEQEIQSVLRAILPNWKTSSDSYYSLQNLTDIEQTLQQHLTKHSLLSTWALKSNIEGLLSGHSGLITEQLNTFIKNNIGNEELSKEYIEKEWLILITELYRIQTLSEDLQVVNAVTQAIESSGAINWANSLREQPPSDTQDKLLPDNWRQVWRLNRLVSFVNRIDARQELVDLAKKRKELEHNLARLYQEVITKRTWLHLSENATPTVRAALEKYRAAIVRIGKGTGKRAPRYRREAQEASEQASAAIPCWIMPHYRISESLPANFGSFDLVIIDEASQSDLTALPALLRAKKVLVVGDDKQVSPDTVGLKEDKIKDLMNQYLANQVKLYRSQLSPDRSIYDLFKVVFASSSIMLKEHFRCAPAIIEFSKREFYDHELKPLRKSKTSERLDPPLIDVYVTDGRRNNKGINLPEARFIVNEIKSIVEDPVYIGRTIGVISLLANNQAREIMEMLTRELGEKVITDFDIACGDARTFQGKERDIMFLSLLVSPGDAHALTTESFAQRINVSASRARDRMYLVRSIELDELSKADIYRSKLIQHFKQPFMQDEELVEDLRSKCESPFELEVFDILVERGYRVIPQVEVGQYRIDMVVEGEDDNSLAIECDGDRYHGPDKWESDIHRQRILERAGWKFWRCFASTFVMHRGAIVEELLGELTQLNIHPVATAKPLGSLYSETRRVQVIAESVNNTLNDEISIHA